MSDETGRPDAAPAPEGASRKLLATHAVLVGLTPLIPVPMVDDLVKSHLLRRMVRELAAGRGWQLSHEEVEALTTERGGDGCLGGCLGQALLYPFKKVFRKIFFFLEWKRAADLTSRTYHHGYLIDHALAPRADGARLIERKTAAEVGAAIDAVCREAPVKPLESAVGATFRGSKNVLVGAAGILERALRRRGAPRPDPRAVAEAVESVEQEEERQIEGVTRGLQGAVAEIPDEHFRALRYALDARLGVVTPERRERL
ncbi:MAG TPA: hypothetical protein VF240_14360 [Pyrinomonadaceae bacterium]